MIVFVNAIRRCKKGRKTELFKCLAFITNRIRFIDEEEIKNWLEVDRIINFKNKPEYFGYFKLYLYHLWISLYENNQENQFLLQVNVEQTGDARSSAFSANNMNAVYFPPSTPPNLRLSKAPGNRWKKEVDPFTRIQFLKNKNIRHDVADHSTDGTPKRKYIQYKRHDFEIKKDNTTFLENLSGAKHSFLSFINHPTDDLMWYKFLFQLYENGHATLMIADERIAQFFDYILQTPHYSNFLNCNLIIPHTFQYYFEDPNKPPIEFYNHKIASQEEKSILMKKLKLKEQTTRVGGLELTYYYFGEGKKVNTLIIHQSLLEKIIYEETNLGKNKREVIERLIWQTKIKIPSFIITSGKNKSDDFSKGVKFLPFSVLEDLVMTENPDKFLLTQILFKTLN